MITTLQKKPRQAMILDNLREFIQEGSLNRANFRFLDRILFQVNAEVARGNLSSSCLAEIHDMFDTEFLEETVQGRGFMKPNGYPGDYLFLDKIYTGHISSNPKYAIWDEYVQQHAAPNAVRNRKEYFKDLVIKKARSKTNMKIMNVVSGSGRELLETFKKVTTKNIAVTCVEIDEEAIDYSKCLNSDYQDRIAYVHSNIFRFNTKEKFQMIWSAGLFDYLNDRAFVLLLKKFRGWLAPRGEIIVGNYNEEHNPSRDYLEILGDWHLIHRTERQLWELAKKAGFSTHQIKVTHLDDKVILYLHLKIS